MELSLSMQVRCRGGKDVLPAIGSICCMQWYGHPSKRMTSHGDEMLHHGMSSWQGDLVSIMDEEAQWLNASEALPILAHSPAHIKSQNRPALAAGLWSWRLSPRQKLGRSFESLKDDKHDKAHAEDCNDAKQLAESITRHLASVPRWLHDSADFAACLRL